MCFRSLGDRLFLFKVLKRPNGSLQTGLWFPGQFWFEGLGFACG